MNSRLSQSAIETQACALRHPVSDSHSIRLAFAVMAAIVTATAALVPTPASARFETVTMFPPGALPVLNPTFQIERPQPLRPVLPADLPLASGTPPYAHAFAGNGCFRQSVRFMVRDMGHGHDTQIREAFGGLGKLEIGTVIAGPAPHYDPSFDATQTTYAFPASGFLVHDEYSLEPAEDALPRTVHGYEFVSASTEGEQWHGTVFNEQRLDMSTHPTQWSEHHIDHYLYAEYVQNMDYTRTLDGLVDETIEHTGDPTMESPPFHRHHALNYGGAGGEFWFRQIETNGDATPNTLKAAGSYQSDITLHGDGSETVEIVVEGSQQLNGCHDISPVVPSDDHGHVALIAEMYTVIPLVMIDGQVLEGEFYYETIDFENGLSTVAIVESTDDPATARIRVYYDDGSSFFREVPWSTLTQ